jgi:hypothetical protein
MMTPDLPPAVASEAAESAGGSVGSKTHRPRCDIRVEAGGDHLAAALASAHTGDRLCLAPGDHVAGLAIDKSVILIGTGGAAVTRLVGTNRDSTLRIEEDGLAVRLEGLTLTGGHADAGGGLAIMGRGKVHIADCVFADNHADHYGGGGLYARGGLLMVERTQFNANHGGQGGAVFLDQALRAEFSRCVFAGNVARSGSALRVAEGVELTVKTSQFQDPAVPNGSVLHVSGTKSRRAEVQMHYCDVAAGALLNGPDIAGQVTVHNCKLPALWQTATGLQDGGGNTFRP